VIALSYLEEARKSLEHAALAELLESDEEKELEKTEAEAPRATEGIAVVSRPANNIE
jgi:hypothetical protein